MTIKTFEDWKCSVEKERKKLREVKDYLNETGLERYETYSLLDDLSCYCETPQELLQWIESKEGMEEYDIKHLECGHAALPVSALRRLTKKDDF